ncbi:MAG: cysteine--tRNA ligase [Alphaproteobacteria bacterium]|nr:cysteine--tRNA ligase [Alphaproteobacteria bacterium]
MSELYLHNTLTRQKEKFEPIDRSNVRMYVCGPTVYDFAHLGNARPVVVFDVLFRLLQRLYGQDHVTYVRNITDIDDKIIARSKESGESIADLTKRTAQAFHEDMGALNALPPTIEPRATEYIDAMIAMIATLVEKGHAYAADGHVLFNVPSMKDYGQLSRLPHKELVAGARVDIAPYKKDAADFVLWKPSTPDQPGWDSPWGRGRPGWHIECSAMGEKNLGETFDIHGGGLDLIFPHHENEIAQSRCAHGGAPLARYWVHNGFLTVNADKMSKSLGNFFTVRDLLVHAPGEALRLALLMGHYRQPLDFSLESLQNAKAKLDRWYNALYEADKITSETKTVLSNDECKRALCDDLNTPSAIAYIDQLVNQLNAAFLFEEPENPAFKIGCPNNYPANPANIATFKAKILSAGMALGLLQHPPEAWRKWQPAGQSGPTDAEIEQQIEARLAARKAKDYAESDRIRDALAAQGVILEDGPGGTTWRRS